jgi:hypothetical protein
MKQETIALHRQTALLLARIKLAMEELPLKARDAERIDDLMAEADVLADRHLAALDGASTSDGLPASGPGPEPESPAERAAWAYLSRGRLEYGSRPSPPRPETRLEREYRAEAEREYRREIPAPSAAQERYRAALRNGRAIPLDANGKPLETEADRAAYAELQAATDAFREETEQESY